MEERADHDPRDLPWYAWLLAPFLNFLILTAIIVVVVAVLHGPFLLAWLFNGI
jgi:hypothetical protein